MDLIVLEMSPINLPWQNLHWMLAKIGIKSAFELVRSFKLKSQFGTVGFQNLIVMRPDGWERSSCLWKLIIGMIRPDSCGCRLRGSVQCVRFHVVEKRSLLKHELGRVFYTWKFDKMGEEVSLAWAEEEDKFRVLIRLNPPSKVTSFWVPLYWTFPFKSWQNLVSYYFSVLLQRQRSYQNLVTAKNVDIDDEESAFVVLGGQLNCEKLSGCWFKPIYCNENRQCDPLAIIG